jgi:pSer/pThr/pTyr-binding forkhead associated (FHA) protein
LLAELVVLNGARAGAIFELPDMPTVVGRSPEAHFQLDDPWISSMHAMFERRGADIWVVDLESRNGTFLGGERVDEALVHPGCVLRFGRTDVRLERRDPRVRPPGRHPTPRNIPISRPTSRLDAPEVTGPYRILRDTRALPELFPVAPRNVVLLRMALHLASPAAPPDADEIRGAVEALRRAALNQGALVVRMGACEVLAVFGAAGASPDDADFALRAAREARDAVHQLDASMALRAALDGGPAVLGNVSGPDGFDVTVLGEVAERTERILSLAPPCEILVGPGASGAQDLAPAQEVRLGGEDVPVARAR